MDVFVFWASGEIIGAAAVKVFRYLSGVGRVAKWVEKIPVNKLNHIFGKKEHALEGLISQFGSREKAFNAVQNAANQALKNGKLTPNTRGILPSGNAGNIISVGGTNVRLIGGRVVNGRIILSSFSRKGL